MDSSLDPHEPAGREAAPGAELHLVQDFVNTNDVEGGKDRLGTAGQLRTWLMTRGLLDGGETVSEADLARVIAVREGIRALGRTNNEEPTDQAAVEAMNTAASGLLLFASLDPAGWHLHPAMSGVDGFLARTLAAVVSAMADGTWSRVKACRNSTCRWLFFDRSRNRSGTWCSMAICGSRLKARAYRARQRQTASA